MTPGEEMQERRLLATMTNEPFQPVRLYYLIPDRQSVTERLRTLECVVEVPHERNWQWIFEAESKSLPLSGTYDQIPKHRRPIILGRIRFPRSNRMILQTNSIQRAIEAARFFGPRLGPEVVAMRCRVVNRCFAAEEGRPDQFMDLLDRDVVVIDPRDADADLMREASTFLQFADPEEAAGESLKMRLERGDDVPLVEDFPLHPEEETASFQNLATTLQLRLLRAFEHWQGNTHLTLTAIIMRTMEEGKPRP